MRQFYRITAYLLFIGVIHTALTPVFYPEFSPDALWFAGTGLALVFLSLLNIAAERVCEPWILNMSISANLVGCIYIFLVTMALSPLEIQGVVALLIFLAVTISSIFVRMSLTK